MAHNHGWAYRSQVSPAHAGRTLLHHLATEYPHSDEATWASRLADGEVTLDGRPAHGVEVLETGQSCVWQRPAWDEPDVPLTYEVVHEDEALLVVNKPAGLPTLPAGGFLEHTLWSLLRARHPGASPVHRLGRFTSGLVACARTPKAAAQLSQAWREHRVEKTYRALGAGVPAWIEREITTPIGPVHHPVLGTVHASRPDGKAAHSVARVWASREDTTVFDVRITTGRPHQIRIHLAAVGHPLVGDPLYVAGGVPRAETPGLPGDGGYVLHAHRLTLAHPSTSATLEFEAAPPAPLT